MAMDRQEHAKHSAKSCGSQNRCEWRDNFLLSPGPTWRQPSIVTRRGTAGRRRLELSPRTAGSSLAPSRDQRGASMKKHALIAYLTISCAACGGASSDAFGGVTGSLGAATDAMADGNEGVAMDGGESEHALAASDQPSEDATTDATAADSGQAIPLGQVDSASIGPTSDVGDPGNAEASASERADGSGVQCNSLCAATGIGTCSGDVCIVDCNKHNNCADKVRCPFGIPCRVLCSSADSCGAGVDCTGASKCDIQCSGRSSCAGLVQCAGTSCNVACAEQDSCQRRVDCSADQCDLTCTGVRACAGGVACISSTQTCGIDCAGQSACAGGVQGVGSSDIRCLGFLSCASLVSCVGKNCAIHCVPESCGGAVCCQGPQCAYSGTTKRCP